LHIFLTLVWFLCCGYATIPCFWFAAHPYARFWRQQRRSPYYALLPIWAALIATTCALTWRWHRERLYTTPWAWIPAALLLAAGFRLYYLAHRGFTSGQLAGRPELESGNQDQRLVVSGIRRRIRHPIYLGHLLEMIGWALGSGLIVVWWLIAFAVITGAIMIRMEEGELEARFGDAYRRYKSSVPAILPSFRTRSTSAVP